MNAPPRGGKRAPSTAALERFLAPPPAVVWDDVIDRGLREDLGTAGDLTTDAMVSEDARGSARVVVRKPGVPAGLAVLGHVFRRLDARVNVTLLAADGDRVAAGQVLAEVEGPARALLTGERVALNLLGRLCGIATATRDLVDSIAEDEDPGSETGGPASDREQSSRRTPRIVCTRKTTPGLRALEKYAVRAGGGANHRFGLDDAVLIKDNHIAQAGGVETAIERARLGVGHLVKIEVEVDDLAQLQQALTLGVDAVLLDNMSLEDLRTAVAMCRGRAITEASGGIHLGTAREIAATGVDLLSVGWLTHSAPALDVGLDWNRA